MSAGTTSRSVARLLTQKVYAKLANFTNVAFGRKYLFFTNVSISFTLSGLGDVLEQHYEILQNALPQWDRARTRKMALTGIAVGIVCHHYYAFLDKKLPGRGMKVLAKKVLIDQLVCSPLYIAAFLATVSFLEGATLQESARDIKRKAWKLYVAEWVVWPPAQVINFYFVPPRFRVLYDSTISLGYDMYTSRVNHNLPPTEETEDDS